VSVVGVHDIEPIEERLEFLFSLGRNQPLWIVHPLMLLPEGLTNAPKSCSPNLRFWASGWVSVKRNERQRQEQGGLRGREIQIVDDRVLRKRMVREEVRVGLFGSLEPQDERQ
jgi:hypothetical protein